MTECSVTHTNGIKIQKREHVNNNEPKTEDDLALTF